MSDIERQKSNQEALPFFAHYLEEQICQELSEEESTSIKGGQTNGTVTTLKYPSDNEDVGGGFVTRKYPSDNEDIGGGVAVTLRYPSDNEDVYTFPRQ